MQEFDHDAKHPVRRRGAVVLGEAGSSVELRDQHPLHPGNIEFPAGFSFQDLLGVLNARVFFWPGRLDGPIDYGLRHFGRYSQDRPTLLRVSFTDLLDANPQRTPLLCCCNSGSPRRSSS